MAICFVIRGTTAIVGCASAYWHAVAVAALAGQAVSGPAAVGELQPPLEQLGPGGYVCRGTQLDAFGPDDADGYQHPRGGNGTAPDMAICSTCL